LLAERLDQAASPDSRLFVGPRGGRISTAVLLDSTHWDEVVTALGYERLPRHDLRAHWADLDGGRRGAGPRAAEDRRARIPDHHPAKPAPWTASRSTQPGPR
jgi:hypothetical protein